MTTANANALFQGLKIKPSFLKVIAIQPGDPEAVTLMKARSEIRRTLRAAFSDLKPMLVRKDFQESLLRNRGMDFQKVAKAIGGLDIRFLTQGSYAYQTLNRPAQPHCQEIDLDDGIYIPMPFVNGRPLFSSDGLFAVIEQALAPLVKAKGWTFKRKDTCVRVCLTGKRAHIDLPLFAVETAAFGRLSELYEGQIGESFRESKSLNEAFDRGARKIRLGQGQILLADRQEDWRPSDPKAIHDWFQDQVERYGPVLRRVCRYLKAWRDETWESCCLSSLCLMVACVDALAELGDEPADDRDDLLALHVATGLPAKLRAGEITWREGEAALDVDWTRDHREELVKAAKALANAMHSALHGNYNPEAVVGHLRSSFGNRFPDAPESVQFKSLNQTKAILEARPAKVAMPLVGTSVSG